ncbi:MAG: sulfatase-like hydrolase/transferase [Pseudomonadales bacterium]|nr:sulfatase-like hydrolase/transferase [Pseudomonadales bacterium]
MKKWYALLFAVFFLPITQANTPQTQPNIIYILADDLGWQDTGFHGSDIRTPSLDQLARGGVQLQQFYAQPMCTPSRAALMTGRYPNRYGLQLAVIPSAGRYGLPTDEWLLPQALKAAGYKTAIIGKWHLGHADKKFWPNQRGFDYQYGPLLGEIDYYTHAAHGTTDWFRNNELLDEKGYVTELLGQDAVRYISQQDGKQPFFMYLTFTAPHAPYQAPQKYLDQYPHIQDKFRKPYAAMITAMDEQIAQVVAALEKKGLRENTLIVFQSDNGGPRSADMTGEVDTSGGSIPASNGPYRDGKGSFYEGGTRVVALANWPGKITAGTAVDQPIHIVDMYPTLVKLANGSTQNSKPLDGMDVWNTISTGATSPRKEVVYGIQPFRAGIRQDNYKLVWHTTLPTRTELFDISNDPYEKTNIADQHPDTVKQLKQRAEQLAAESAAPMLLGSVRAASMSVLFGSVALPEPPSNPAAHQQSHGEK